MADICQTCLSSGRHLLPLKNIQTLLMSVGLHEITKQEGGICWECKSKVVNFHKFKEKVRQAQDAISQKDINLNSLSNLNIENTFLFDLKSKYNVIEVQKFNNDNAPVTVKEEVMRTDLDNEQNHLNPIYVEVPAPDNNSNLKVEKEYDTANVITEINTCVEKSYNINKTYIPVKCSSSKDYFNIETKDKKIINNLKNLDLKNEQVFREKEGLPFKDLLFKCNTCLVGFNKEESYENHMTQIHQTHKDSELHVCKLCEAILTSKELASEHIMSHNIAKISELSSNQCQTGMSASEGSVKFDCRLCNKSFSNHEQNMLHKCTKCAKVCTKKKALRNSAVKTYDKKREELKNVLYRKYIRVVQSSKHEPVAPINPVIEIDADTSYITIEEVQAPTRYTENFECNGCQQTFSDKRSLTKHKIRCVKSYENECHRCGKKFLRACVLRKHLLNHAPENQGYQCDECGKEFKSKLRLRCHIKTHSRKVDKDAYCAECDSQFRSKLMYRYHMEQSLKHITKEQWKFKCDECGNRFRTAAILKRHQAVHRNEYNYRCNICSKEFKVSQCLSRHMRRRHGDESKMRNKICDYCGKAFKDKNTLQQHINVHLGIRPYLCTKCGLSYSHSGSLHHHMQIKHSNKRPQIPIVKIRKVRQKFKKETKFEANPKVCEICGNICKTKAALEQHMNSHLGLRPYKCKLCDAAFSHTGSLHTHNKSVHLKIKVIRNRTAEREKSRQKKKTAVNLVSPSDGTPLDEQLPNYIT